MVRTIVYFPLGLANKHMLSNPIGERDVRVLNSIANERRLDGLQGRDS